MIAQAALAGPDQSHQRLEHLCQISNLFATFETVEDTFDPALGIVAQTLPLRSAILIETDNGRPRMIVWASDDQTPERLRVVKEHLATAYTYLVGDVLGALPVSERPGPTPLPPHAAGEGKPDNKFIVVPLVVARRPPFGALQLEGAHPLDKTDLMFVNAIANQLAIALARDRAWRRDITRRQDAEEARGRADANRAIADRGRASAETMSTKYEALAGENAALLDKARQAVRVREQILAIVSHDLRNPLGTILLTAGILTKRLITEEGRPGFSQSVGRIQRSAERMLRLIEDLLDFANIEIGNLAIRRQPKDAGAIIQETLASFEGVAQENGLRLTAEIGPQLHRVYCDGDRLLQVFSNLVGNAIKATPEGGQISLRVEAQEHELLFAVSDSGRGISEDDLKHLFERYWRSGETEYKGTGLGLAISSGIVNAHGGRMWATSEVGQGATFFFTIPAADETSLFVAPGPDGI